MGERIVRRELSPLTHAEADWSGITAVVAGLGVAGYAAATALLDVGASVTVIDPADSPVLRDRAEIVEVLGGTVRLECSDGPDPDTDVFVVSPGIRPGADLIQDALSAGIPIWGELELAWRMRSRHSPAPWLCVTGTNGKTTATLMLASILHADGRRVAAAGNVGESLIDAVRDLSLDVIAVEVSATQMPFVESVSPFAAACLNLAPDHLDFFDNMDEYRSNKALVYRNTQVACIYNVDDVSTEAMVRDADVVEGCRAVGFTLGVPSLSMLGIVEDVLVDRAFIDDRATHAQELATIADVPVQTPAYVSNALAAAALARAFGVSAGSVGAGLRNFQPAPHRMTPLGSVGDIRFINDSQATNAHAAATSLGACDSVVWIAGGQAKGQSFEDLVSAVKSRLTGVVLIGVDRAEIARALRAHAPDVPVVDIEQTGPQAMEQAVRMAWKLAGQGDTVLLAPACASWDMYMNYGDRGDQFARAVAKVISEAS